MLRLTDNRGTSITEFIEVTGNPCCYLSIIYSLNKLTYIVVRRCCSSLRIIIIREKERKKEKGKKDKLETTVDGSALASGARAEKDVTYEKYSLHGK